MPTATHGGQSPSQKPVIRALTGDTTRRHACLREAIAHYETSLQIRPGEAATHNGRCYAYAGLDELGAALADCTEAIRLQPKAYATRAIVYLKMGRVEDAAADYDAALAIEPNFASAIFGRGLARRRTGNTAGAEADAAAARGIDPDVATRFARVGLH